MDANTLTIVFSLSGLFTSVVAGKHFMILSRLRLRLENGQFELGYDFRPNEVLRRERQVAEERKYKSPGPALIDVSSVLPAIQPQGSNPRTARKRTPKVLPERAAGDLPGVSGTGSVGGEGVTPTIGPDAPTPA